MSRRLPPRLLASACALILISATNAVPSPRLAKLPASSPATKPSRLSGERHPERHHGRPRHKPIVSSVALHTVAKANRAATLEPAPQGYRNAVQVYPYADGALYHVYTAPGRVTDIALQPGETLGAVASGDTVRWLIGDTTSGTGNTKTTHILVKPFSAGLSTNLVITTDRRSYHLALTSTAGSFMAALSWIYPADQFFALKQVAAQKEAATPVASGLSLDQLHFNYSVTGDKPTWRPLRTFDDGRQTFIEFPASIAVGEAPPLFLVDAKGVASLVNYRVQGRFYIVDRIFDAAELRLGTKHQDIVRISRVAETPSSRRGA